MKKENRTYPINAFEKFIYHGLKAASLIRRVNPLVRQQEKDPSTIPILIVNYNRVSDLKKMVSFFLERNHKNIVILDNNSTYPPLLEYYKTIQDRVKVEVMDKNYGHMVFWDNLSVYRRYASGYHIVTDSDIIPNPNLPEDYLDKMLLLLQNNRKQTKVGFALRIDDIPDSFSAKQKVIRWEEQFWKTEIDKDIYIAQIDTTFAMYRPWHRIRYHFPRAIRMAGDFTARHGGWYIDSLNQTEEESYYYRTSTTSNSWKLDENGNLIGDAVYVKDQT